jgi:hypothetical protein
VLQRFAGRACTILDLGAGRTWASARMWREYLPDARVVSVDIRVPEPEVPEGVEFVQGDLGDVSVLTALTRDYRPDVVIEDASHLWPHQLLSLVYLLPAVSPGGVYIWEDLHVSAPAVAENFRKGMSYSPADFLGLLIHRTAVDVYWVPRMQFDGTPLGITEVIAAGLIPLIDTILTVRQSAIFVRRA